MLAVVARYRTTLTNLRSIGGLTLRGERLIVGGFVVAGAALGLTGLFPVQDPGSTVVHNLICSWVVPEVIRENGGTPVRTRVGHSFIKAIMAETGAIFGGEHSGHYYFRENYRADSGLIAGVIALAELSRAKVPLSERLAPYRRYFDSGEINSRVEDVPLKLLELKERFGRDGKVSHLDGLSVDFDDWHFNVRPSNTEPLLRLNLEATSEELLKQKRDEVLAVIRS